MKLAALIVGVVGGLVGIIVGGFQGVAGGVIASGGLLLGSRVLGLGVASMVMAFIGLVIACLARRIPLPAGIVMLVVGLAGFGTSFLLWLYPGLLFIAAGILAIVGRREGMARAA